MTQLDDVNPALIGVAVVAAAAGGWLYVDGAQDRDVLRPDAQPRHLLDQEHPLPHLHHVEEDGHRAKQGVLWTLRVLRELRQTR